MDDTNYIKVNGSTLTDKNIQITTVTFAPVVNISSGMKLGDNLKAAILDLVKESGPNCSCRVCQMSGK